MGADQEPGEDSVERGGGPDAGEQAPVSILRGDDLGQLVEAGLGMVEVIGRTKPDPVPGADVVVVAEQLDDRAAGVSGGAETMMPRRAEIWLRQNRLPVVYVTVPTAATPKILAIEFARFYGIEFGSRATMPDIVNTVCAVAARTHLELVLIDEIHNIIGSRAGAEVSDQLKYFAERLQATFAYAGIEVEEQGLFAGPRGRQIAGRFTLISSAPFDYGTPEQRDAWRALVATLEQALRLHDHRPGTLVEHADYLYQRTGGMIGSLSQLVRGAAVLAIDDETERITPELLELIPLDHAATRTAPARGRGAKGKATR
ncbi:TniB family NTP-binding protein [Amycolatopsis magusensis]|uniref:TniB family NTP-binding protein n=1 Tax=Amycolatopsis magusensis TaxID=882444 RepID=UPI0037B068F1